MNLSPDSPDVSPQPWECLVCETLNTAMAVSCEVCSHAKPLIIEPPIAQRAGKLVKPTYRRVGGVPGEVSFFQVNQEVTPTHRTTLKDLRNEYFPERMRVTKYVDSEHFPVRFIIPSQRMGGMWVLHENNKLSLWDVDFLEKRKELFLSARGDKLLCFSGPYLMGSFSKSLRVAIRIYQEAEYYSVRRFLLTYDDMLPPDLMAISLDATLVAAITPGGRLLTWSASLRTGLMPERPTAHTTLQGERPLALAVAPHGEYLAIGLADGTIELRSEQEHGLVRTFTTEGAVTALIMDEQGQRLFVGTQAGKLYMLPVGGRGDLRPRETSFAEAIHALHWLPGPDTLALAAGNQIHLWDVAGWEPNATLDTIMERANAVCQTSEGRLYAGGSPGYLDCWMQGGEEA